MNGRRPLGVLFIFVSVFAFCRMENVANSLIRDPTVINLVPSVIKIEPSVTKIEPSVGRFVPSMWKNWSGNDLSESTAFCKSRRDLYKPRRDSYKSQ